MKRTLILVASSGRHVLRSVRWAFGETCRVVAVEAEHEVLSKIREERPHLVILDCTTDLDLLQRILTSDDLIKVIVVAEGRNGQALRAIRMGAFDVCRKPVDPEELRIIVQRALHIRRLEEENDILHANLDQARPSVNIVGACPQMEEISNLIRDVSNSDAQVLIQGERGTGKEMAARAIHNGGSRRSKPFVVVNCGALPEHLLEGELFGQNKDAGIHSPRRGKIEMAEGGTLLLDDVGTLSDSLQARLFRLLDGGSVECVGGSPPMDADVRLIASTPRNLRLMMEAGSFREDLYYHLEVVTFTLPPLRERGDDVMLLANAFLRKYSDELGKKIRGFTGEANLSMRRYAWPGNVRELENKVKRGVILARETMIGAGDLSLEKDDRSRPGPLSLKEARRELDIRCIKSALEKHQGIVSRAARELCISRVSLHNLIKKYSLR